MSYGSLKTLVAAYAHRSDLTSYLDGFVDKARARLLRDLRDVFAETYTQIVTWTDGVATLPSDLEEIRSVHVEADDNVLQYLPPSDFHDWGGLRDYRFYTLIGREIHTAGPVANGESVRIDYYRSITARVNDSTTDSLLDRYEYLAVSLALAEIYRFERDYTSMERELAIYAAEVAEVNAAARRARFAVAPAPAWTGYDMTARYPGL